MNSYSDNIIYAYEEDLEVPIRVLKLNSKFYYNYEMWEIVWIGTNIVTARNDHDCVIDFPKTTKVRVIRK